MIGVDADGNRWDISTIEIVTVDRGIRSEFQRRIVPEAEAAELGAVQKFLELLSGLRPSKPYLEASWREGGTGNPKARPRRGSFWAAKIPKENQCD